MSAMASQGFAEMQKMFLSRASGAQPKNNSHFKTANEIMPLFIISVILPKIIIWAMLYGERYFENSPASSVRSE